MSQSRLGEILELIRRRKYFTLTGGWQIDPMLAGEPPPQEMAI